MTAPLLQVRSLAKHFLTSNGRLLGRGKALLKAVDGIDFDLEFGETLGLVGESGCGKSTSARLVLRLIEASSGEVRLDGQDVLGASTRALQRLRRDMQLVFQDPLSSLNPRMSVGTNIAEPLRFHGLANRAERTRKAQELLDIVGLNPRDFDRFPHEFSGGQCQRVAIARALVLRPKLVIFDEPVSALDVSIQAQILTLLLGLQEELQLSYIFISHDLSVVKRIADRIAVMYLGKIVETGTSELLYREPLHPYSKALLDAIPLPDPTAKRVDDLGVLEGDIPSPIDPPSGCRFRSRCPHAMPVCAEREPPLKEAASGHQVACFLHE